MSRPICTRWISAVLFVAACGNASSDKADAKSPPPQIPGAKIQLVGDVPGAEWRLPAGDFANTRYSSLDQLTRDNVGKLKVLTVVQTGVVHGHEGQPLVVGNRMYAVTPWPNNLLALDLTLKGALEWVFRPHPSA